MALTSESEGVPGVVLEAGAAGVPTVGYKVGGVSDVVIHDETGLLVDAGAADDLADGLVRLASHREMLGRLAAAVRTKVREEFGLKAAMDRYDHLLRALLAGSDPLAGDT